MKKIKSVIRYVKNMPGRLLAPRVFKDRKPAAVPVLYDLLYRGRSPRNRNCRSRYK